jgi:hypothetical protein
MNGIYNNQDEFLKLPVINSNIQKKYNYPVSQKSEPNTSIYNVIKNLLEEHHLMNKNLNVKKKKIEWEDFKNFSAYQIFTLLSLNRNILKILESKIFPRRLETLIDDNSIHLINE